MGWMSAVAGEGKEPCHGCGRYVCWREEVSLLEELRQMGWMSAVAGEGKEHCHGCGR